MGLSPVSGRSPREGNGNPLQYACQENPMDRGAWQGHRVTKELDITNNNSNSNITIISPGV